MDFKLPKRYMGAWPRSNTLHYNGLLEKKMESLRQQIKTLQKTEQIKTLQKTVENYELESENYKKQTISASESEKSSITEQHKCLVEEKLTTVPGLKKDTEQLEKEVKSESLVEQIKTLQKTVENCELQLENYKKEICASESEMSSIAEQYKCLWEEKLTIVSGIEKDTEQLKKEVESLMEQINSLQKTVENFELESENYKKQICASEREKSSIAEQYKCLLEEKLTTVTGLVKDNEQLKKDIDSRMEKIVLESKNYKKKQIIASKLSELWIVILLGVLMYIVLEIQS